MTEPATDDRLVLVVGATGFVGRRVVSALLADGRRVRCLVRDPGRAHDFADSRTEVVAGDMLDADAVTRAVQGVDAVVVCVHTISRQASSVPGSSFVDIEAAGLSTIADACHAVGVRRIMYLTSIGVAADAASPWLRGRWRIEQMLFSSGFDATVLRPGMIVGTGGAGFGAVARAAHRPVAVLVSSPSQRFRTIHVDDLARQLVDLLDDPRSFGRHYDVGSDDVLTMDAMVDLAAEHLGRRHPVKLHLPRRLLTRLGPLVEKAGGMPPGAMGAFLGEGSEADLVGDPSDLRHLLPGRPRPFRDSLADVLG